MKLKQPTYGANSKSNLYCSMACAFILILLSACSGGNSISLPEEGENLGGDGDVFAPERLLEIEITLPPNDFATLKSEGRSLASTARDCVPEFEYTEFEATVVIDGVEINKVGIRKKGFLGSLSPTRPSLKLDFDEFIDGQTYQNRKRMTLNNNRQDPSNARQCMAYDYFRREDVGLIAPRCNFARVTVNGEFMGIYTHVEPIKKPFLKDNYTDDEGNLYEAQIADFGMFIKDKFEKKTNKSENDRSDLQVASDFFTLDDEDFIQGISTIIDLDEFIRFWAMETLLGHWDSATGNANNFYIYRSPIDNLFHFIPWGTDAAFTGFHFLKPDSGPLYRNFNLASRLYEIPEYKIKYEDTLQEYLDNVWNEVEFETELNRIAALTETPASALESIKYFALGNGEPGHLDYIRTQRARIESAISGQEPAEVVYLIPDVEPTCAAPFATNLAVNASALNGNDTGTFTFTLPSGHQVNASISLASTNVDSIVISREANTSPEVMSFLLIGADVNDAFTPYVLQVFVEEPEFTPGTHEFHGFATNVLLFAVDNTRSGGVRTLALGDVGRITLSGIQNSNSQINVNISIDAAIEFSSDISL